jgi:hypothetical protein
MLAVGGGIATGLAAHTVESRGSGTPGSSLTRPLLGVALVATLVLASHGLLDTVTDGGFGVALLWPFSLTRFFAPWRPIPVAPIGPAFFTPDGAMIALTELVLPLWLYAFKIRQRAAVITRTVNAGPRRPSDPTPSAMHWPVRQASLSCSKARISPRPYRSRHLTADLPDSRPDGLFADRRAVSTDTPLSP